MDSIKKKTAISGNRIDNALTWCLLKSLINSMISVIIQDRFRSGTNTNRNRRRVNPESIRLNPKIKSNLAPTKRINGNWVRKITIPLKIFNFSSIPGLIGPIEVENVYFLGDRVSAERGIIDGDLAPKRTPGVIRSQNALVVCSLFVEICEPENIPRIHLACP